MPLDPGEFRISETTEERFNELRPRKERSTLHPQWEGVLDGLAAGKVIELEAPDPQRANTLRRSLGRMAAGRDMKLEFSGEGTTVLVGLPPLCVKALRCAAVPPAAGLRP